MSFLTLFTADAAAAHGHEFSTLTQASFSTNFMARSASTREARRVTMSSVATVVEEPAPAPPPAPKKAPRTKTSYHLAQPPPSSHHLHLSSLKPSRSLVLQLQRLSNSARPVPTYDVLPASVFAPKLKRHFSKFFKYGIGLQDLVFLSSEEYDGEEDDDEGDDENLNSRHVVASVCHGSRKVDGEVQRTTVIRFCSGPQWEVTLMPSGGYEFIAEDENDGVMVARWNPKFSSLQRRSYQTRPHVDEERKFQFSVIDPTSRKHPLVATMTRQRIDILDQHTATRMSWCSAGSTPPESAVSSRHGSPAPSPSFEQKEGRPMVKTDEYLRTLILVTGIWVALREGFAYNSLRTEEASSSSPISPSLTALTSSFPLIPKPCIINRSSSAPAGGKQESLSEGTAGRGLLRHGTMVVHNATTNSHPNEQKEGGAGTDNSKPRRAQSVGGLPRQHRSHTVGSRLSMRSFGIGTSSPVSERSTNTSRAATPDPSPRATPPDDTPSPGCISRRFISHRNSTASNIVCGSSPRQTEAERTRTPTEDAEVSLRKEETARKKWGRLKNVFAFVKKPSS